jgi:hypothetical protein
MMFSDLVGYTAHPRARMAPEGLREVATAYQCSTPRAAPEIGYGRPCRETSHLASDVVNRVVANGHGPRCGGDVPERLVPMPRCR